MRAAYTPINKPAAAGDGGDGTAKAVAAVAAPDAVQRAAATQLPPRLAFCEAINASACTPAVSLTRQDGAAGVVIYSGAERRRTEGVAVPVADARTGWVVTGEGREGWEGSYRWRGQWWAGG